MGSISIEGYVRPPSSCSNIIINNGSGGVSKEELNEFISNFNSLDTNSVDVDSTTGISVKISNNEDNILKQTEDGLLAMLSALEVYAIDCYNKTTDHIFAVNNLTTVEEIEAYDYRVGYPEKLTFEL